MKCLPVLCIWFLDCHFFEENHVLHLLALDNTRKTYDRENGHEWTRPEKQERVAVGTGKTLIFLNFTV